MKFMHSCALKLLIMDPILRKRRGIVRSAALADVPASHNTIDFANSEVVAPGSAGTATSGPCNSPASITDSSQPPAAEYVAKLLHPAIL